MGYAGYVPQKTPPPKPTEVQSALWQVGPGFAILGLLNKSPP